MSPLSVLLVFTRLLFFFLKIVCVCALSTIWDQPASFILDVTLFLFSFLHPAFSRFHFIFSSIFTLRKKKRTRTSLSPNFFSSAKEKQSTAASLSKLALISAIRKLIPPTSFSLAHHYICLYIPSRLCFSSINLSIHLCASILKQLPTLIWVGPEMTSFQESAFNQANRVDVPVFPRSYFHIIFRYDGQFSAHSERVSSLVTISKEKALLPWKKKRLNSFSCALLWAFRHRKYEIEAVCAHGTDKTGPCLPNVSGVHRRVVYSCSSKW